jgi:N-acetylglucosaminyldiphosphoundecaprenol N-acetyl-beta-D-mannosaminyltransferase
MDPGQLYYGGFLLNTNPEWASGPQDSERGVQSAQWVGPINFIACGPDEAAEHIVELAQANTPHHIHLANAYTIALADKHKGYRNLMGRSGLVFPDGKPLTWISALRGDSPRLQQVRGPKLFLDVFDRGRSRQVRHYLVGSTPEVLKALVENLEAKFPGVAIVGSESPPFRQLSSEELGEQDSRIRNSDADIVWVGLGTPKQDFEAERLAKALPIVAIAIGAAFDFAAGTTREAPVWVTKAGLEWAYRLVSEPRRLWKRYLFGNTRFLIAALGKTYPDTSSRARSGDRI